MNVMMIVAVKLCLLAHNYTESLFALFALPHLFAVKRGYKEAK